MLHKLIATLRKRGAHGRTFPVQATEATQAAEIIAGVVAQRDELLDALTGLIDLYDGRKHEGFAIVSNARAAIARAEGGNA